MDLAGLDVVQTDLAVGSQKRRVESLRVPVVGRGNRDRLLTGLTPLWVGSHHGFQPAHVCM